MRLEDIDEYTELYTEFCKCGHKKNRHKLTVAGVDLNAGHCYECTCQSMELDKKEWEERNDRKYPEPKEYKENCDRCDGTGEIHPRLCVRCDGTGEIQFHFGNYDGIENAHCHKTLTCPDCGASKEESK